MWNLISSNRLLDQKSKQESYRRHKESLRRVKPLIDVAPPAHYHFLVTKPKTKQLALQHELQIQVENSDLVRRMMYSKGKPRSTSQTSFSKDSLHSQYFKKMSQQIDKENRKLVQRLKDASSSFSFNKFEKQHQSMQKWKTNMSRTKQVILTDRNRQTTRPASAR